jgi:hypothetical protein
MTDRSLVRNAADPKQVRRAARKEAQLEEQFTAALRDVLSTTRGRFVIWELLRRAGVFRSIWVMTAEIHYRAGQQDFGHRIQADVLKASESAYELMSREARLREKREANETDAAHTPRAEQGDRTHGE